MIRIERRGKVLKRELEAERTDLSLLGDQLSRSTERRILRLEAELESSRKDWTETARLVKAEERRLIENPAGFLRFT